MTRCLWPVLTALLAQPVTAQDLRFPSSASKTAEEYAGLTSFALPNGPWSPAGLPADLVEGQVLRQAWRIANTSATPLQMLRPLRDQLRQDGYRTSFECVTDTCGGFDFRFALDVVLPPAMEVNLNDFHYIAMRNGDTAIGLLSSRTTTAGYVQVTWILPDTAPAPEVLRSGTTAAPLSADMPPGNLEAALEAQGRFILDGLEFAPGSAQLSATATPALAALADYLAANPARTVALVGHTDAAGSLEANIALSRRRAATVLEKLVSDYDVPRQQLEAQGMGYLAPVANNLDEDGRARNRRVEVIVTSTQR